MSFLKATSAFLTSFAIIFIKLNGFVEDNVVQPDVFNAENFTIDDAFSVNDGKATFTIKYDVTKESNRKQKTCMIFAMPNDWSNGDTRVNSSNFDISKWTSIIKSKLEEENNKQGFARGCSGDVWKAEGSELNTVFFDLTEDSTSNKWVFNNKDIEDLFAGTYVSKDSST